MTRESTQADLKRNLEENIVDKKYVTAEEYHRRSLWTRDVCFSAQGLALMGYRNVVIQHIELHLESTEEMSLGAKVYDNVSIPHRVCCTTICPLLSCQSPSQQALDTSNLKSVYWDSRGIVGFDGNLLILYAAKQIEYKLEGEVIQALVDAYTPYIYDGLLRQPAYSDFFDTQERSGVTFHLNYLYLWVISTYKLRPEDEIQRQAARFVKVFYQAKIGLFRAEARTDTNTILLDQLLFLADDTITFPGVDRPTLLRSLLDSPLYFKDTNLARCAYPSYPTRRISYHAFLGGMQHHHDLMVWPWLTAFLGSVCVQYHLVEEADKIAVSLRALYYRDETMMEIYSEAGEPFRSCTMRSEENFTMGLCQLYRLLHKLK